MRKPAFCIGENKDTDQRGNRETDQRLCSRYTYSTISLLPKYGISSLRPSSVAAQPGFLWDLVGNPEDRFSHNEPHMPFSLKNDNLTLRLLIHARNEYPQSMF